MPLSLKQQRDVCLVWQGAKQCRYVKHDDTDHSKVYCLKKRKVEKQRIDKKVNEFIHDAMKKKVDPKTAGVPLGDNCDGFPVLKHVEQGLK